MELGMGLKKKPNRELLLTDSWACHYSVASMKREGYARGVKPTFQSPLSGKPEC